MADTPTPNEPPKTPANVPSTVPPVTHAASPPAAATVATGKVTEADAAREAAEKRKLQTRLAELEDENKRLKDVPRPPAVPPAVVTEKRSIMERFLAGEEI
jgi:hypothetical protein